MKIFKLSMLFFLGSLISLPLSTLAQENDCGVQIVVTGDDPNQFTVDYNNSLCLSLTTNKQLTSSFKALTTPIIIPSAKNLKCGFSLISKKQNPYSLGFMTDQQCAVSNLQFDGPPLSSYKATANANIITISKKN